MQVKKNDEKDQASGLRTMNNTSNNPIKVIAVTGGKGGVGKTSISINMALVLAQQGKKVMLLDADLGLANIDVMLGIRVEKNLSHVLSGDATLDEIIVRGPENIGIIPASSGIQEMSSLTMQQHAGLISAFNSMESQFDVLIVDTAAGISDMVMSFAKAAQHVVMVVCDEPSSITDAYAMIKILSRDHGIFKFKIIANMVNHLHEGQQLFSKLLTVSDRFLDVAIELVATIPFDENVRKSARKQKLIVEAYPSSPAAMAYKNLAKKAISWSIPKQIGGNLSFFIERSLGDLNYKKEQECE